MYMYVQWLKDIFFQMASQTSAIFSYLFTYGKILDPYKWYAFADSRINVTQKLKFGLESIENIVGKEENAD